MLAIVIGKRRCCVRIDEQGERIGQTEPGGELGAVGTCAQHPDRDRTGWFRAEPRRCARARKIGDQFFDLLRKVAKAGRMGSAERGGHLHLAPRSAAEAKIDAVGIEVAQHRKRLRNLERAIMGQHDTARADTYPACRRPDCREQHFRRTATQGPARMMFGHPIAVIAKILGATRRLDCLAQHGRGGPIVETDRLVEQG